MRILSFLLFTATLFLTACGGEKTTPNGYEFTKHTSATGNKAAPGEYAYVHLYIRADGTLINSTRDRGEPMPIMVPTPEAVVEESKNIGKVNPISDVLAMLSVGDSVTVIVPIDSQMRQSPQLVNVKQLSYDVVLVDLKTQEAYQADVEEKQKEMNKGREEAQAREAVVAEQVKDIAAKYKSGELKNQLKTAATGLKYMVIEAGTGNEIEPNDQVSVHYYGALTDGNQFDNSFGRGQPYPVKLGMGQVIKGWDEGIPLLKGGDKAVLFIPSDLGYGKTGSGPIPPDAELIFYVEIVKVGI